MSASARIRVSIWARRPWGDVRCMAHWRPHLSCWHMKTRPGWTIRTVRRPLTLFDYLVAESVETLKSATFTTAETVIGTVTFDRLSGCGYVVDVRTWLQSSVPELDVVDVMLREGSVFGHICHHIRVAVLDRPQELGLRYWHRAEWAGPKTFVLTARRAVGSGNVWRASSVDFPQRLRVLSHEHIRTVRNAGRTR